MCLSPCCVVSLSGPVYVLVYPIVIGCLSCCVLCVFVRVCGSVCVCLCVCVCVCGPVYSLVYPIMMALSPVVWYINVLLWLVRCFARKTDEPVIFGYKF
jgi:hypothetical protein